MNSYDLSRKFVDFSFENPSKIKPNHYALYFFAIEHCNRLGWKKEFGLPTTMTMEAIGIRSYNTYSKTLKELIKFGFFELIESSKNQYSANIIALSNFNKALDKALDKAFIKHRTKQRESTEQSIDSIDKPINQLTIEQTNKENDVFEVSDFEISLREYFSQTTEILKMRLSSFLRSLKNKQELESFKKQTEAYIKYKKMSEEKAHGWLGYQTNWNKVDWIDKLNKLNNIEVKKDKPQENQLTATQKLNQALGIPNRYE